MRIRFLGSMPSKGYSGGRLLSLTMAEALAQTGPRVEFLSNAIPEMYEEFRSFSKVEMKAAFKGQDINLSPWVDENIDVVVVVPGMDAYGLHGEWVRHAIECRAKLVLLNFETPNWFNQYSPVKREPSRWYGWDVVSEYADLILSISGEGNRYAKEYFTNVRKGCRFDYCFPAINSILADRAPEPEFKKREIVMLTRVDGHKGFDSLAPLLQPELSGYTVNLYLGISNGLRRRQVKAWRHLFDKTGMDFQVHSAIKGVKKFRKLKESRLLYFPTRFEGFGIPPLEAAYCKLPCVTSDLPVLREHGQDAYFYADPTNVEDMKRAILRALEPGDVLTRHHARFHEIGDLNRYGDRLIRLLEANL
jgi:glycosyltransferase involved in cell wall biosynthesis